MYIIQLEANPSGGRTGLQGWSGETAPEGFALCPDEFFAIFYSTTPAGFVNIEVEDDVVVGMEVNQEALEAYIESCKPDMSALAENKAAELSAACREAIVSGVDVSLSDGSAGHFSLEETDQINLTTAFNAVQQGATGYPYHADGQLCRVYPADDIIAISNAATAHKLYHTTYCNHMMAWARRAETVEELEGIVYGAELPEDLAANMNEILTNAEAI